MGFTNLYGLELQWYAVEKAKELTKGINILQGSGFDIPFKDNYFDAVCTNDVLIHIAPENHAKFMSEIVRCSKQYIFGFEYYADEVTPLGYRGTQNTMWKADYEAIYRKNFPNLVTVKREFIEYVSPDEKGNVDILYMLEKK